MSTTELFKTLPPPPTNLGLLAMPDHMSDMSLEGFSADPTTRLREYLDEVREFRETLAALRSETEREREAAREAAAECWELALLYYDLHARFAARFAESGDPILQTLADLNEEIAVEFEDTAESEALAASKPFARLVDRELKKVLPTEGVDAGT